MLRPSASTAKNALRCACARERGDRSVRARDVLEDGRLRKRGEMVVIRCVPRLLQVAERGGDARDGGAPEARDQGASMLRLVAAPARDPLAGLLERLVRERAGETQLIFKRRVRHEVGGRLSADGAEDRIVGRGDGPPQPDRAWPPRSFLMLSELPGRFQQLRRVDRNRRSHYVPPAGRTADCREGARQACCKTARQGSGPLPGAAAAGGCSPPWSSRRPALSSRCRRSRWSCSSPRPRS